MSWLVGEYADYYSDNKKDWYACKVVRIETDGGVSVLIEGTADRTVAKEKVATHLRKPQAGSPAYPKEAPPVAPAPGTGAPTKKVLQSPKFKLWLERVDKDKNFTVEDIHFQSIDMFGPNVGFAKFKMTAKAGGKPCPAIVFMRGGAPAILVVLKRSTDNKLFTITVNQPRIAVGCSSFMEIPAGMLDGDGNLSGVAAKEMKEETGLIVGGTDLVNMTELVHGPQVVGKHQGIYSTCGGSDEYNPMFVFRKEVEADFITKLEGKETGRADEFEQISLKVIPLDELWKKSGDSKALSALCLYKELLKAGDLKPFSESEQQFVDSFKRLSVETGYG